MITSFRLTSLTRSFSTCHSNKIVHNGNPCLCITSPTFSFRNHHRVLQQRQRQRLTYTFFFNICFMVFLQDIVDVSTPAQIPEDMTVFSYDEKSAGGPVNRPGTFLFNGCESAGKIIPLNLSLQMAMYCSRNSLQLTNWFTPSFLAQSASRSRTIFWYSMAI